MHALLDPIGAYVDNDNDTSAASLPRPPPAVRKVAAAQRFAAYHPDEAGKEIVRLRDELDRLQALLSDSSHASDALSFNLTKKQLENRFRLLFSCPSVLINSE